MAGHESIARENQHALLLGLPFLRFLVPNGSNSRCILEGSLHYAIAMSLGNEKNNARKNRDNFCAQLSMFPSHSQTGRLGVKVWSLLVMEVQWPNMLTIYSAKSSRSCYLLRRNWISALFFPRDTFWPLRRLLGRIARMTSRH